jgi:hypothetical protein
VTRILLVEDQPQSPALFRQLFDDVDVCTDIRQLNLAIEAGREWAAAFVDFDLSGAAEGLFPTGLSALLRLREARPQTRRVVYTTLGENGRTLYAVAAYRWLDTAVVLDKSYGGSELRAAASPHEANPTPLGWQTKLTQHAYLIDHLFAKPNWLALWRIWRQYNGSIRAVGDDPPPGNNRNSVREFSVEATGAMTAFREAFYGSSPTTYDRRGNSALATPLVAFAYANDKFFNAPDLEAVLAFAKPWDRVRPG